MVKRVAVIGAGSSGLTAIKCCLDEGLEPTCFERTEDIGGLWRFKETPEDGRASIYKSVIINTSKEMMCFSDFPIPDDFPNYMHNVKILEYFRMYAKHFDLLKYIRFKTTICSIKKRPDFSSSGQWDVISESDGKQESDIFDAILVCSGHHTFPHLPLNSFPGIEKFKGRYFHSREYKDPFEFHGKRIIVIGIGNSGGDLAVELSSVAKQVYLSTRRGAWVVNRVSDEGFPLDVVLYSRYKYLIKQFMPTDVLNSWAENKMNARFNHENYGLKPCHRIISQHPTINDDLPNRIISGKVLVRPNVKMFTETAAIFEDGTMEENIDAVFFATGYSFSFPFFEDPAFKVHNNKIPLYKLVYPADLEKMTVAFIGFIQPIGAIMPIAELQARWATRVFKGLMKLPSVNDMKADIAMKRDELEKRYVESPRHTIQVDFMEYLDELAMQIDVKPNLLSLLLTDPKLAKEVFFGPCSPYQYRLRGPGKWEGARQALLTQRDRIIKATKLDNQIIK
ncbi:dimethylaniline monooxygenase [N-oxide-forming] 5-like isoform X1 [Rhinatrema bivittatum]|uniref:dimethylaniline monooxygenase [N-oxide-forming] 5-like isoform X1 n=1 Tax=Rhinatrema bivittatum TaxID=194408 RepID=UPI001125F4C0|nr:dimethylaniline monooxygenase [N-oxide-forming] 5-like isoform X1 [Rhinatrema bivittatum]XP_029473610.1 dimethylaniline monooxygenase [N-oxide-forming] 5-like isoform X1 [Rhinatrema bivittatum]XP_029473611.1 dimethylaniline monooxygenase [N-oxide-forming] 5-like isoform X1 [Rhinatrema bivittatum]